MVHHRSVLAGAGIAAAIAVAIGASVLTRSDGDSYGHGAAGKPDSSSVVNTQAVRVGGKSEVVLTDAQGLPLYYYAPDTATKSLVSGQLASLWPPVTSPKAPVARGLTGQLSVVHDSHGNHVAYNGHLLYTFVSDRRGVVTGQGLQDFFLATPQLAVLAASSSSTSTSSTNAYGGY